MKYEKLTKNVLTCLEDDLQKDSALCEYMENEVSEKLGFYESELNYFPLSQAIEKIDSFQKVWNLNTKDTFGLVLYYPLVGFDPQTGYEFSIILYGSTIKGGRYFEYDYDTKLFSEKEVTKAHVKKVIDNYRKLENGCGTGYLFYFYRAFNARKYQCHCAYDINN